MITLRYLIVMLLFGFGWITTAQNDVFYLYSTINLPSQAFEIKWSPDSQRLVVEYAPDAAAEAGYDVYDIQNKQHLCNVPLFVDWSPTSVYFAARDLQGGDGRVYDSAACKQQFILGGAQQNLIWSPNSQYIASVSLDGTARIYNAQNGQVIDILEGLTTNNVESWSFDSTHILLSATSSNQLKTLFIWTIGTGISAPIYNATGKALWSSDSSQLAIAVDYTKIHIVDATTGTLLVMLRATYPNTNPLDWTNQWLFAESGEYVHTPLTAIVWDWQTQKQLIELNLDIIDDAELVENTLRVTRGFLHQAELYDLQTGQLLQADTEDILFYEQEISPDAQWAAKISNAHDLIIYSRSNEAIAAVLTGHEAEIKHFFWSPNSQMIASIGQDNSLYIWKRDT